VVTALAVSGALAISAAAPSSASVKTLAGFTSLHSFGGSVHNPNSRLVEASDGNFYGTSSGMLDGKDRGTVYRMTPGGTVTIVHTFDGTDGDQPVGLIVGQDGALYGVTRYGGTGGPCSGLCGTLWRMDLAGATTVLHQFQGGTIDGNHPNESIVRTADGAIYGTTISGVDRGVAWRYGADGSWTLLHVFSTSDPAGAEPRGGLMQASDGNFYGVANQYGPGGQGTVFKMTPGGAVTVVHGFAWTDGGEPRGQLVQAADGYLYGVTEKGGGFGFGTIFRTNLSGTAFSTLHRFDSYVSDGGSPVSGLTVAADGLMYGVAPVGGLPVNDPNRAGVVYSMTPAGAVTVVHTFTGADGDYPQAALAVGSDGSLYGTTWVGGSANVGTAFRLGLAGNGAALSSLTVDPTIVQGGSPATGTIQLTAPAPVGGAVVTLSSSKPRKAKVPVTVTVPAGSTSTTFLVSTKLVRKNVVVAITASYAGVSKKARLTVTP
jgi:uncharacterized repeat protein (TIGR03803 family)